MKHSAATILEKFAHEMNVLHMILKPKKEEKKNGSVGDVNGISNYDNVSEHTAGTKKDQIKINKKIVNNSGAKRSLENAFQLHM